MPEYPFEYRRVPLGAPTGVRRRSDAPFASASPRSLDAAPTRSARSFDAAPTFGGDDDDDYDDDGASVALPEGTHSAVGVPQTDRLPQ
jgi:hypothetical protein